MALTHTTATYACQFVVTRLASLATPTNPTVTTTVHPRKTETNAHYTLSLGTHLLALVGPLTISLVTLCSVHSITLCLATIGGAVSAALARRHARSSAATALATLLALALVVVTTVPSRPLALTVRACGPGGAATYGDCANIVARAVRALDATPVSLLLCTRFLVLRVLALVDDDSVLTRPFSPPLGLGEAAAGRLGRSWWAVLLRASLFLSFAPTWFVGPVTLPQDEPWMELTVGRRERTPPARLEVARHALQAVGAAVAAVAVGEWLNPLGVLRTCSPDLHTISLQLVLAALVYITLAHVALWSFFTCWSHLVGMPAVDNMPIVPFFSASPSTSFRSWHASLSRYLRELVYKRTGSTLLVFALMVAWHAPHWSYAASYTLFAGCLVLSRPPLAPPAPYLRRLWRGVLATACFFGCVMPYTGVACLGTFVSGVSGSSLIAWLLYGLLLGMTNVRSTPAPQRTKLHDRMND